MTTDDQAVQMEDLAARDLDRAHESLYFAARRYCAITEQTFLQDARGLCPAHDPEFVHIGDASADLVEAAGRYGEAYGRWASLVPPDEDSAEPPAEAS